MDPSGGSRQDLLRAAVHFLQNPKVTNSTLSSKRTFLLNKGLKDEDIDEAINLALANLTGQHETCSGSTGNWSFMLMLGACYGAYTLYKMYSLYKISLSSEETNKVSGQNVDQSVHQNETMIKPSEDSSLTLTDVMKRINDLQRLLEAQKSNLASEIQSIKSLMLNHNQFEGPPSIPPWQKKKEEPAAIKPTNKESKISKHAEKTIEIGASTVGINGNGNHLESTD